MLQRFMRVSPRLAFGLLLTLTSSIAAKSTPTKVIQTDSIIAGGPDKSLEVRHLVLRGTNEQIGQALAELGKERYGVQLEPATDPILVRARRQFFEHNNPILLARMRGVAAAFGKSIDDDHWDFSGLGFTELKAGCSIAHLPPSSMTNGKSVVSRDYDFTTGDLSYGFLRPGMLHPTARPYLLELHPDQGYASIAMVSYDLLNGVLDGINSEGLTVSLAMQADMWDQMDPTRSPAVGLNEVETLRLLLDECSNVDEAKQMLMTTKQYYRYVPCHYLIADRFGNAFVWEFSKSRNQEYVVENPGQPLVMTNFTIHEQLQNGAPPSPEKARPVCKRYAYLCEKFATGKLDDETIRGFHQNVDAQMSQAADTTKPPERTLWHAFYYPEDRRVRVSYYLGEEPYPGEPRFVKPIRSDYVDFRLEPTEKKAGKFMGAAAATSAAPASGATAASDAGHTPSAAELAIESVGGTIERDGSRVTSISLVGATQVETVTPLLPQFRDVETLSLGNPGITDADVLALKGLPKLHTLGLMGASIGDKALAVLPSLPELRILNVIDTKVTDAGLIHLQGRSNFEYLGLKGTVVTDKGLEHLKGLTGLTTLNLADTKVSDAGLVHLSGMTRLEGLNLSNDNVTDAGLEHLSGMTSVAGLNLSGTKVTDAGLAHLQPLKRLTKLNLTGTPVTDQGVTDAKKYLPSWAMVSK